MRTPPVLLLAHPLAKVPYSLSMSNVSGVCLLYSPHLAVTSNFLVCAAAELCPLCKSEPVDLLERLLQTTLTRGLTTGAFYPCLPTLKINVLIVLTFYVCFPNMKSIAQVIAFTTSMTMQCALLPEASLLFSTVCQSSPLRILHLCAYLLGSSSHLLFTAIQLN